ncbi:MAG: UDP-glucose/GDP-mannose dehydrogenase family protein [Candidatus Omnitrophica bacterium]|nr:UDP-glucose/GDP-mannose dehydrogenase family protein [Candidatus Omnitrophota bacterium]
MNICVVGVGYVGLVVGTCLADFGHNVVCVDTNKDKIDGLKNGISPIYELGLEELIHRNVKEGRLSFTTDLKHGIQASLAVYVAVNTPNKADGTADLSYVQAVAAKIAEEMDGYKVIILKSTVPVGTCAKVREIISKKLEERVSEKNLAADVNLNGYLPTFSIVSNPEFLREGSAIEDFMRPNRVVIGAESDQVIAIMKDIYRPLYLLETPMVITNLETAELIKYASNAFLATKISFINEMSCICEKVGADVNMIAKGMGLDRRIGSKFLHTGPGYGGSCFPKDTQALLSIAKEVGYEVKIVKSAIEVNEYQKKRMISVIKQAMQDVEGKTIGILGLAFKPNTDDMRDAAAITIINGLQELGAKIKAFDPVSMDEAKKVLNNVEYCESSFAVAENSDALVILTEWNEFRQIDFSKIKELLNAPVIIDTRNLYDPERMLKLGFEYTCIGRGNFKSA